MKEKKVSPKEVQREFEKFYVINDKIHKQLHRKTFSKLKVLINSTFRFTVPTQGYGNVPMLL